MKINILITLFSLTTLTTFFSNEVIPVKIKNTKTKIQTSEGEKLIAKSDCVGCHKIDKKLIGPSYLEIAKKYPSNDKNINYLTEKIIKGGSGVWGTIPMAAHTTLKKEDAKKMVKYIMSLNK